MNMTIASKNIRVPSPCSQQWDKMPLQDQGRTCKHCSHVVTDFTRMSDEEVVQFLVQHRDEKVCGHFRNDQLSRLRITVTPAQLQSVNWTVLQQVRIAIFLVFASTLFSCSSQESSQQAPEIMIVKQDSFPAETVLGKSIHVEPVVQQESKKENKHTSSVKTPPRLREMQETTVITEQPAHFETTTGAPLIDMDVDTTR